MEADLLLHFLECDDPRPLGCHDHQASFLTRHRRRRCNRINTARPRFDRLPRFWHSRRAVIGRHRQQHIARKSAQDRHRHRQWGRWWEAAC